VDPTVPASVTRAPRSSRHRAPTASATEPGISPAQRDLPQAPITIAGATSKSQPTRPISQPGAGPPSHRRRSEPSPLPQDQLRDVKRVAHFKEQLEIVKRELVTRNAELEKLRDTMVRKANELDAEQRESTRLTACVSELGVEMEALRARAEKAEAAVADGEQRARRAEGKHDSLQALMAVRAERIRELEAAIAEQQTRADAQDARIAVLETSASGVERDDAKAIDELETIYGIGPSYARRLHELGITQFAQIAAWTDDDIDDIANKIRIPVNRVHNHDWRGGARAAMLAAEADQEARK